MLKGHTKIVLTNVETGEQEVHEDDNLVTKALDKIININMSMNRYPNDYLLPIATKALGGIMLFDGELTESADNIHFPTEAHLVGYANTEVDTKDTHRGSYNATESGKIENGFVSVWDFGTSQANGEIKSVARTHNKAGACPMIYYIGDGGITTRSGNPSTDTYWYPIRYEGEYMYMLKCNTTTHQMRLARARIPKLRMGVEDYSDVAREYEIVATWDTLLTTFTYKYNYIENDTREVSVYADSPWYYEDGHDGYIYCVAYDTDYRESTSYTSKYEYDLTYFTIKYSDGSFTKSETIRKNVGVSFYKYIKDYGMYWLYRNYGHVCKGKLYLLSSDRKSVHIIPLDNVASYNTIRIISDDISDYITSLESISPHEGGVYFEIYHYETTGGASYRHGVLYPDGVYVINNVDYSRGNAWTWVNDSKTGTCDDDLLMWGYYTDIAVYQRWTSNYLGTINNLASPITKTAAQTMKIIYTLKDVNE